jgi:anti-anti-sigma factor
MPQAVVMNVREINNTVSIIDIEGDVSAFAEDILMEAYSEASLPTTRTIVLNFNGLEYMNSSGIGLLVTLLSAPIVKTAHASLWIERAL